ncbi:hypothetical protein Lser_V15G03922 [Lactuca serriola]
MGKHTEILDAFRIVCRFHSQCPQTARKYYHPPAENHSHGGDGKPVGRNGGADDAKESWNNGAINTFDVISVF